LSEVLRSMNEKRKEARVGGVVISSGLSLHVVGCFFGGSTSDSQAIQSASRYSSVMPHNASWPEPGAEMDN